MSSPMPDEKVTAGGTAQPGRQRAPTISIDDTATTSAPMLSEADGRSPVLPRLQTGSLDQPGSHPPVFAPSPTDNRGSRPTSPHNISSPRAFGLDGAPSNTFLAVPGPREPANSVETDSQSTASYGGDTKVPTSTNGDTVPEEAPLSNTDILNDSDALKPDPGTEADFKVENSPFAFSVGQLNKMINPKSLSAFYHLGGLAGIEKGLRSDRQSGLSSDEVGLQGQVTFEEALQAAEKSKEDFGPAKRTTSRGSITNATKASSDAFADRKRIYSDNRLPEKKTKSFLQLAWIAYNDKILILLTAAAVISLALGIYQSVRAPTQQEIAEGTHEARVEWVEGVAIIVAILVVTLVGALNDYQKERQFVKLNKKKEERMVKVVRSGKSQEISVYDIMAGDVVHLEPGDLIPVDGILIDGHNLRCDESSATGESDIIRKQPADDVYQAIVQNQVTKKLDPFILSGGKVAEGVGTFLATSTGVNSSYGKILMSLKDEGQTTPLQSKLNILAEYIAKLGLGAGLLLFLVLFIKFVARLGSITGGAEAKGQRFLQIFIVAVTIIVVAVPEGLPLAVTLALAFATTRMLKDNNLVRLLRACETMGNATTVCSDKTGTLTQNKMTVVAGTFGTSSRFADNDAAPSKVAATNHKLDDDEEKQDDITSIVFAKTLADDTRVLLKDSIVLNSTAFEGEENGQTVFIGSKTETALLTFAQTYLGLGPVAEERANAEIVQMVPFDSGRKCMAVVIKLSSGKFRLLVKGASEILIAKCTHIISEPTKGTTDAQITSEQIDTLGNVVSSYASRSLRTIGLLYRDFEQWPPRGAASREDARQADFDAVFRDMTFLGVVGIQDPLRPGVTEAVRDCQIAGVFVRMVTGDNLMTAKAIATECGIFTAGGIAMEGPIFRRLTAKQLNQVIPRLQVLARSSPEDKKLLVGHLKKLGETVAVTGDGTNDAPALKTADVGFSMGIAGTEVAKEASAIILMDDNFASIVKAIQWGRTVNDAVKKFLQFQITVNITAVLLTFISAVSNDNEESVLTAVQLLWVNLIMDTFAALALATDAPSPHILKRRPEPKSAPLISLTMWKMIIGQSIYQLAVTLILYFAGASILGYETEDEMNRLQSTIFNTFVWSQIFNQWNARRLDNGFNIFEGMLRNYWFIGIQFIIVGGQILIMFIGGAAFSIYRINGPQWGYSIVLGLLCIPFAVVIRCFPDELFAKLIPSLPRRHRPSPDVVVQDEEDGITQWNPALEEIRDELGFLKKLRGGRMSELAFKLQHPRQSFLPRSRSSSKLHPKGDLAEDDPEKIVANAYAAANAEAEAAKNKNATPDKQRKRTRASSNSVFGPVTAMAGIVAGSVAGGWSPIERRAEDPESVHFQRSRAPSGVEGTSGIEIHPATATEDPVFSPTEITDTRIPPSQNPSLAPHFDHAPPPTVDIPFGRRSHSRHSSTAPKE
ncbi:plasma membrane calcium [Lithohypha guttulata]|uniref:Calcium-transporting ATPase n=1 Tax=Lithohypha guttulata TaxID=1690604 RepID=A0AAN7YF05_9EURO|nr:plasma membrane calcium [Lithohypha guttulata]